MKRKIFFIVASILMYGSTYAQNHYNFNPRDYQFNLGIVAQIKINGVEQTSNDLELGAFNGESIRGSQRIGQYGSAGYYRAIIQIYGNPIETNYEVTFKLYNHSSGEELDNCDISYLGEPYTILWTAPHAIGNNSKPVVLNFVTTQTFEKPITAYTSDKDRYYLIASPIGTVSPENVTSMLSNSYDLYYFDQSQDKEWINYKGDQTLGQEGHFSLEPGKGYLYANSNNVTLTFTGTPYNGNGQVDLAYDANAVLKGWNLIGNPFGAEATLDKPYYRLNTEGNALKTETENTPIATMEGVFVQATATGEKANFTSASRGERADVAKLNISVVASASSSTALDNAIVRFDGGATLGKFQLNPSHTKVYIPQDGKDYAIVRSAAQGEMPLNFKAEKNGTYTLNFSAEEVTFSYLHLIDNMTGADVDLLAGASTLRQAQGSATYTFEAKTTDYASRFRLVFNSSDANEAVCEPSFAYFNGSNWMVNNQGKAMLQVIDVMGRVLSSETISGNTEININQPAGVYMLRLIDNENVRVQKVVVR